MLHKIIPALLRERTFFLIWLVEVIAIASGHVSHLALPIIGTTMLHATPTQMGGVIAAQSLPFALFSLLFGVWVDRARKTRLLIGCYVVLIVCLAALPVAWWLGALNMPLLYVVAFGIGSVMSLFGVAHQVLVTHTVGRERLVDAYRIISTTESIIRLAAPAVAGLLIESMGAPKAVVLEVMLLVFALGLFAKVKEPTTALDSTVAEPSSTPKTEAALWPEIRQGLAYVWQDRGLRAMAITAAGWQILFHGFLALQVLFATRELHMSAGQIGVAHLFGGVGALLAGVSVKRLNERVGPGRVLAMGLALTAVSWGLFSVLPSSPGWNVLGMGSALLLFDLGAVAFFINYISMRQILTPDALLGRVTATMRFAAVTFAPAGALLTGVVAESIGLRWTFGLLGVLGVLVAAAFSQSASVRRASDEALRIPERKAA